MTHTDHRLTGGGEHWNNLTPIPGVGYTCGYCSAQTASATGFGTNAGAACIRVCPRCNGPTFFALDRRQWPGPKIGISVQHLPGDVLALYEEARDSIAANAFTGAVMLCRKILMHVAVEKGAKENRGFQEYVQWLLDQHYAPRGAEGWVDYIRKRSNDANHEIVIMTGDDASAVLNFTSALLRNVYELPMQVPSAAAEAAAPSSADSP